MPGVPELGGVHMWAHLPCDLGVRGGVCMRGSGLHLLVSFGLPHLASLPSPGVPPEEMGVGTCSEGAFLG